MRRSAFLVLFLFAAGCVSVSSTGHAPAPPASRSTPASEADNRLLYSVLWVQTAGEYRALSRQAWAAARTALDHALADPSIVAVVEQPPGATAALPPALIVDIDETVLDNSAMEARLIEDRATFTPERWDEWVQERAATPVPGSLEFLRYAASRGVTVFYVSNREATQEAATRDNLVRLGYPVASEPDVVLLRGEIGEGSEKTPRRASVASRYRVVLMAGDDLGDFLPNARVGVAEREEMVRRYESWWGTRWIVLPNPMYGSWEGALTAGAKPEDRDRRLLDALRPLR
ncbi:MAG TPA: 5'-nucleotidase, lipoprotein e(P4) family [Thermoanaerobaculia bacterium]|nr:5'-nucleotidase, lipoprotein e(P4) family [Thermoanaerobaculia bacterium]